MRTPTATSSATVFNCAPSPAKESVEIPMCGARAWVFQQTLNGLRSVRRRGLRGHLQLRFHPGRCKRGVAARGRPRKKSEPNVLFLEDNPTQFCRGSGDRMNEASDESPGACF